MYIIDIKRSSFIGISLAFKRLRVQDELYAFDFQLIHPDDPVFERFIGFV
jgi:hypothetical protein